MSVSPRWRPKSEMTVHEEYPRDIVKPAALKNDVNSMHSVWRKKTADLSLKGPIYTTKNWVRNRPEESADVTFLPL